MLRETQWSPDTCGCVLTYTWDDAQDENARVHTFSKAVQLCEYHKPLATDKAYDAVLSENTRKNIVFGEAQRLDPTITLEDYTWSFDKDRKLQVGFLNKLKAGNKSNLRTLCDSKFGTGKVEVI